ncbi:winged helix-turn-helix transcriptional regulator [Paractinoplanes brasiliensis]|uniref:HxlR family transcriptional regulator n=1 Tax=Paractinoplanes brasiliensis TaxID=52695 RepID=A0A4R6JPV2_9ACTN|nr:helix-turn-helix domain-containing protein [Actinoplanes brasiliensis]TDO37987.1 HxlR family transcriptional regulator [Actinoplanes brasiliensis]GID31077.1 transcriptional regulator [Actinoplanes brasiliensis]
MAVTTKELCSVRRDVLGHVGGKWSSLVLILLETGPRRYSEIHRSSQINQRMLTLSLHQLERDGLVARSAGNTDYELTEAGRSLVEVIKSLISWTDRHYDHIVVSRDRHATATSNASAMSAGRDNSAM